MRILLRFVLNALAIAAAAWFFPGIHLAGPGTALIAGAILAFVNLLVKPILVVLTLPLTLVTLGLFLFIVNALCLGATAAVVPGFDIDGFWAALGGALVVSLVSWVLNGLLVESDARKTRS